MCRYIKQSWFLVMFITLIIGCQNHSTEMDSDLVNNPVSADGTQSHPAPAIQFTTNEHDFGKIVAGEKVTYNFKFKNTGTADLLITKVSASCGCTAPSYPTTPIAPGKEGFVSVAFNSENRSGFQNKTVTVLTNTIPNTTNLRIKAKVMNASEM